MTFSNAERQARWRDRQQVKIDHVEKDWGLFVKAAGVFLRELARQGRSGAATASPATVAILTAKLRRLIERWPSLPVDVKKQLAAAKDSHAMGTDYLKEKRPCRDARSDACLWTVLYCPRHVGRRTSTKL